MTISPCKRFSRCLVGGVVLALVVLLAPLVCARDNEKLTTSERLEKFRKLKGEYEQLVRQSGREQFDKPRTKEQERELLAKKMAAISPQLLRLVEQDPKDEAAFEILTWLMYFPPEETRRKVLTLLIDNHGKTRRFDRFVLNVCFGRAHYAPQEFLERVMDLPAVTESNRALACWELANRALARARETPNAETTAAAEKILERLRKDFADSTQYGSVTPGEFAERSLRDLRLFWVGKTAPEIEGEDLAGKKFKLSDYRGKVVLLHFWLGQDINRIREVAQLDKRFAGKPFTTLSVNFQAERDYARQQIQQSGTTTPVWWARQDLRSPIARKWDFPRPEHVFLLDSKGVIRYRGYGYQPRQVDPLIEKLLSEAEKK
jgi:hypothetical protein